MRKPKVFSFTLLIPVMIMFVAGVWSTPTQADAPASGTPQAYGTPTVAPPSPEMSASGVSPAEQQAIEKVIRAYFDIRYGAFVTLELGNLGEFVSTASEAQSFLALERDKLSVQLKSAKLNNNPYASYKYSLDYKSTSVDTTARTVVVSLAEGNDVVFSKSQKANPAKPVVSHLYDMMHTITLQKEEGAWKIVSDHYDDFLWQALRKGKISTAEMLRKMETPSSPTREQIGPKIQFSQPALPTGVTLRPYDGWGAASYAAEHVNNHNPDYPYYKNADCTNFTSQALYLGGKASEAFPVGGLPPPSDQSQLGWYYVAPDQRATAWNDVEQFFEFATDEIVWHDGPYGHKVSSPDDLEMGDLIQFNWDGGKFWDHTMIVVGFDTPANEPRIVWVDGHSDDQSNIDYTTLINPGVTKVRFLHILGSRVGAPRGYDTNGMIASYYNDVPTPYTLDAPILWNTFTSLAQQRLEPYISFELNTGDKDNTPVMATCFIRRLFWGRRLEF